MRVSRMIRWYGIGDAKYRPISVELQPWRKAERRHLSNHSTPRLPLFLLISFPTTCPKVVPFSLVSRAVSKCLTCPTDVTRKLLVEAQIPRPKCFGQLAIAILIFEEQLSREERGGVRGTPSMPRNAEMPIRRSNMPFPPFLPRA